jgi:sarcosine oxidase delta subunit
MNGTVTIPLKDFDELREAGEQANAAKRTILEAAKELEVFLSFLITRENLDGYIEEFNRQSSGSEIKVINGRVKVYLNGTNKN